MKSCVHCGVSFSFPANGFFHINGLKEMDCYRLFAKNRFYLQEKVCIVPYDDLTTVEELTQQLSSLSYEESISCTVSKTGKTNSLMPLTLFAKRLNERHVTDVIQKGEFVSYLQPIIDLKTNEVYGYESLLRSKNGPLPVPAGKLFAIANETGLHSLLDQRAREEAIKAKKKHVENGKKVFINFLPSTIYNPEYCLKHTFSVIEKYGILPEDLVFEVVETEQIHDIDHLKKVLDTYRRRGIKVALDDVGAGFSTLDMLELLEPDYVKIDRSYISYCDQDAEKAAFLKKTYELGRQLGIKMLAEGIERQEEFEFCKSIGFDLCQGYLFGKPVENPNGSKKNEVAS